MSDSQNSINEAQNHPHSTDPAVRELILRAQGGSDDACRELRRKYRPLIEASVARFGVAELTRQEKSDLHEEADRVFLGAISTYDCDQDAVDFGLYAKICLRNRLISEWRRMEDRRRVVPVEDTDAVVTTDPRAYDPAGQLMEEEGFLALCRTVRSHLSDFENRVWWPYVTGVPVSEIAKSLACEERAVHNAVYRIRRKLRERIPTADGRK